MKKILGEFRESPKNCVLFFILVSYLLFAHTLQYDFFIYDDLENIVRNPNVLSPTIKSFFNYWIKSYSPLPYNFWQIISLFFGVESAAPYRLANIIIHGFNLYLAFEIFKNLAHYYKIEGKNNLALHASVLFAAHPLVIESVVWPSSLRTILGAFFALSYLKHSIDQKGDIDIYSYILIFCSILSNPIFSAIAIIPLLTFFEIQGHKKSTHALAIISLIGLYFYFHKNNIASSDLKLSLLDQIKLNIYSLFKYIQIINFPIFNSISYQLSPNTILSKDSSTIFCGLGIILLYFGVPYFILRKSNLVRSLVFFQGMFFLSVISNCGLFLHDFSFLSIVSDRYGYLAIFSNGAILLIIANHLMKHFYNVFYVTILFTFIFLFYKGSFHWNNQIDLITNSITFHGRNAELFTVAGVRAKNLNHFSDAQYFFNQAIAINKNDSASYMHLIQLLKEGGNRDAISSFLNLNQSHFLILESNILLEVCSLYLKILDTNNAEKYLKLYLNLNPANDRTTAIESEIKDIREYVKKINL